MLVDIKIHSAFKDFFPNTCLKADIKNYADITYYLGSMHPKFLRYAKAIEQGECQEGYALMDKNFKLISDQDLFIKIAKKDDVFYLVPAIVGGGGKRSNLLLMAALAFAIPGALSVAGGGNFFAAYGSVGQSIGAGLSGGPVALGNAGTTMAIAQTVGMNVGLALITSYFTSRRDNIKQTDQAIRTNDMFGSLQNTVDSGTPIPLVYGLHRVTGQLISGYLDTVDHGKSDNITVASRFTS